MAKLIIVIDTKESAKDMAQDFTSNGSVEATLRNMSTGRRTKAQFGADMSAVSDFGFVGPKGFVIEEAYVTEGNAEVNAIKLFGNRT